MGELTDSERAMPPGGTARTDQVDVGRGVGSALADAWDEMAATGAWRPGDPPADRRFAAVATEQPLALEAGGMLGPITVAYETWGRPNRDRSNAILVLHALTGDSHLVGPAGPGQRSAGWWESLVGPGGPLDPAQWWIICPNVLGGCQGTTGPSSTHPGTDRPWGPRFPLLTVRDQVAAEAALADELGVETWAAVIGGSMGGMRALEWAVSYPERVTRAVIVACGAAASAEQIALCAIQAQAIRLDPGWAGGDYYDAAAGAGPARGLGLARRLGQVSYRSEEELATRFGRRVQDGEDPLAGDWAASATPGRFSVEGYLDHQALKLASRFDANSYLVLSRAMDLHDVGRERGGIAAALARAQAEVTVAGVDSDRLYPIHQQEELAAALPTRGGLRTITSVHGHDGFLIEQEQIAKIVADALS
jgi:homoserine O-acetyltransferase